MKSAVDTLDVLVDAVPVWVVPICVGPLLSHSSNVAAACAASRLVLGDADGDVLMVSPEAGPVMVNPEHSSAGDVSGVAGAGRTAMTSAPLRALLMSQLNAAAFSDAALFCRNATAASAWPMVLVSATAEST